MSEKKHCLTIYEYNVIFSESAVLADFPCVPSHVFTWLEEQALLVSEKSEGTWLRLVQRQGKRGVQVTNYVGVIRSPRGYQIEVLPKIAKSKEDGENTAKENKDKETRSVLIDMLRCLPEFRHIQTESAHLTKTNMPLLEVFIGEFLRAVEHIIQRGLQSNYTLEKDNLFVLRGKLAIAQQIQHNFCRRDRFFVEFDEFSHNRPENRVLHTALRRVLSWTHNIEHQRLARTLRFAFADIPISACARLDFQQILSDRNLQHYTTALAWARLILEIHSPLTGMGQHQAPSLLFPMDKLFEAFVTKHIKILPSLRLVPQVRRVHLVEHLEEKWFSLQPDMLIQDAFRNNIAVLDTKWKLLDANANDAQKKYGLSSADFYQLHAYGQSYINGKGILGLIYPKTDNFESSLPEFTFIQQRELQLWVLPFCLKTRKLLLPPSSELEILFVE